MAMPTTSAPLALTLTAEGRRLLLALLEWAEENGYPVGPFERDLLARLRG